VEQKRRDLADKSEEPNDTGCVKTPCFM
jgi:hypothetical protein